MTDKEVELIIEGQKELRRQMNDSIARLERKLDMVSEVVIGNGDVEKGLVTRVTRVEESVRAFKEFIRESVDDGRAHFSALVAATVAIVIAIKKLIMKRSN